MPTGAAGPECRSRHGAPQPRGTLPRGTREASRRVSGNVTTLPATRPPPIRGAGRSTAPHAAWLACCLGRGALAPVEPGDAAALAAELEERRYAAGTAIFRQGDAPARVHILRRGLVELSRPLGRRRVALQVLHPGDAFGDVPLLVRIPEPFDAVALEDSVVLSIDSLALTRLLETRPRLAHRWLISVAERMSELQGRLVDLLAGDMEAQVASFLVREAENGRVDLSQAVLAELVGGRRTSVNRVLKALEARGLVGLRYRGVDILDREGLLAVADPGSPARS